MDAELAYLAGFFDGEGCVSIGKSNGHYYHLMIQVAQVDPKPLIVFQQRWGGYLRRTKRTGPDSKYRAKIMWNASASYAAEALKELLPFLIVKKEQAELAIEFQQRMANPLFDGTAEYAERERMYLLCKSMKQESYDDFELPKARLRPGQGQMSPRRVSLGKGSGKKLPGRWENRDKDRYALVERLRAEGKSLAQIGAVLGVTRGRVHHMLSAIEAHKE